MDVPDFHGRLHPEDFLGWLSSAEKFFDWKELLSHVYDQVNAYTLDALLSITKEAELLVALIICRPLEDDLHQPKVKMRRNSLAICFQHRLAKCNQKLV